MKTRIRCTEVTVAGVVTKSYRAEVFCWWYNWSSFFWAPAIRMLADIDPKVYWADDDEMTYLLGGHPIKSEERAKALIDRLWNHYNYQKACDLEEKERKRQAKKSRRVTFENYP